MPRILAAEFAEIARELAQHTTLEDTLQAIAHKAVHISGAEAAGITVRDRRGQFSTVAATNDLARQVDALQFKTGEGPCLQAITEYHIFRSDDIGDDPRWPTFGPLARQETDVISMMSHRLFIEEDNVLGALNVYSRKPEAFSTLSIHALDLLATHSAIALGRVAAQTENEHLRTALESNRQIGVAIGILMAAHKVTQEQAFDLLRVASQHAHRKLADIADTVVETGHIDPAIIRDR